MRRIVGLFIPGLFLIACGGSGGSGGTGSTGGSAVQSTNGGASTSTGGAGAGSFATGGVTQTGGTDPVGGSSNGGGAQVTGGAAMGGNGTAIGGTSTGTMGGTNTAGGTSPSAGATNPSANVRVTQTKQTVDGFGFSTAWGSVPSAANLDAFLSTTKGAGLSIIRNRIPFRERPDNNDNFMGSGDYTFTTTGTGTDAYKTFTLNWGSWDLAATKKLITSIKNNPDYQITSYFSTPWTPPNNSTSKWKLGVADYANKPDVGGYLDPAHYQDYADVLADYALGFQTNMGVPLTALSLQNEPNFKCDYESADWSATQFHEFMKVLKTEFAKKGVFTQLPQLTIMAPEHNNMDETLIVPTLNDANLSDLVGIVAGHQYEYGWASDPLTVSAPKFSTAQKAGKKIWMTEWSVEKFLTASGTTYTKDDIYPSLALAKAIHTDFTAHGLNAYVYWWSAALVNGTSPAKVLWTLAQYSRFVRPGWIRVDTNTTPTNNVLLSAFVDPSKRQIAVVAVNMGTASQSFPIAVDTGAFGTAITPYRTSATENLAQLATIPGGSNTVQVTVPAQSITTFSSSL